MMMVLETKVNKRASYTHSKCAKDDKWRRKQLFQLGPVRIGLYVRPRMLM